MKEKIKGFFYSLATNQKKSFIFWPVKFVLFLLSLLYKEMVNFIIFLYRRQFLKVKRLSKPVISVGNITLGGTGKTPLVFYLAKKLENYGKKTAILTRGYGEDEKFILEESLSHIPVLAGKNRVKNANLAIEESKVDVLLMDDSLQQWGIYKDLEIAVMDSTNPFGNGYLLPRGVLREPIRELSRADVFLISKLDKGLDALADLRHQLLSLNPKALIVEAVHEPISLSDAVTGQVLNSSFLINNRVILLSALGDNEYFKHSVLKLKAEVKFHFTFIDHYQYKKEDWIKIAEYAQGRKIDIIVTTSKDAVKLKKLISENSLFFPQIKLLVLNIELKILKGEDLLNERLLSLFNR